METICCSLRVSDSIFPHIGCNDHHLNKCGPLPLYQMVIFIIVVPSIKVLAIKGSG